MKQLFLLLAVMVLGQTALGQSALPNGNFESWTYNSTHGYYEPDGGFFKTLNILDTIPTPPGITAYPCDTAHDGTKSARLITREMLLGPVHIVIPGVIGTLTINWFGENATLGTTYTWPTKPERFQGFFQAYPVSTDSTGAILLLSKWNGTSRDTIAYNRLVFHGQYSDWTEFDEMVNYWDNTTMPDSITVLLLSCAGYNALNMMGSVGQIGSMAMFDDVTLTNIPGVEMLLMPEVEVKLSPNPVSDQLTVTLSETVKQGVFEVITVQGQKVAGFSLQGNVTRLDISQLPAGTYFYRLTNGSKALNTGTFIVTR